MSPCGRGVSLSTVGADIERWWSKFSKAGHVQTIYTVDDINSPVGNATQRRTTDAVGRRLAMNSDVFSLQTTETYRARCRVSDWHIYHQSQEHTTEPVKSRRWSHIAASLHHFTRPRLSLQGWTQHVAIDCHVQTMCPGFPVLTRHGAIVPVRTVTVGVGTRKDVVCCGHLSAVSSPYLATTSQPSADVRLATQVRKHGTHCRTISDAANW